MLSEAYVPTKEMGGGSGAKYAASSIIYLSKKKEKDGTTVVGNLIKAKTAKSRLSKENKDVTVRLYYDERGLDRYYGLLELGELGGLWKNVAGRYEIDGKKVYAKAIFYKDPEQYFTPEVMEKLDEIAKEEFRLRIMIKILKTGINVDKVVQQLKKYPQDWDHQKNLKDSQSLVDRGFADLPVSALQLIMGGVRDKEDFVGDSEINIKTPAYAHHSEIRKIIRKQFKNAEIHRCGFLSLPVDEIVGAHIDEGTYYQTRNRYHLSILGRYQYFCGKESVIVEPGTLLWFNNKLPHGTVNVGDETRITFVFDIPHGQS